jgi:O-antigen ligase
VSVIKSWDSFRPWPVYAMAAAVPISLAATSITKVIMFFSGLAVLGMAVARQRPLPQLAPLRTPAVALLMLAALALSLTYTSAPLSEALHDLSKYHKLLIIPIVLALVRTRREALLALGLYVGAQVFVVVTSYLLSMDLALPWVPKPRAMRLSIGSVYSSYLDQSIMTAGLAALCWHLRGEFPGRHGRKLAIGLALMCAVNVLFFLPGRSAQVALLVAIALALFWGIRGRGKWTALVVPPLLLAAAMGVSPQVKDRVLSVVTESRAYSIGDHTPTSSGLRLGFWRRSIEAFQESPIVGHGVGSFNGLYRRLQGSELQPSFSDLRNPHQEYLLWAVQLGIVGVALFLAFLLALARDASRFRPHVRHAAHSLVAMFAAVCLFNATLFDALIGDFFCIILGLLLALGLHSAWPGKPLHE